MSDARAAGDLGGIDGRLSELIRRKKTGHSPVLSCTKSGLPKKRIAQATADLSEFGKSQLLNLDDGLDHCCFHTAPYSQDMVVS